MKRFIMFLLVLVSMVGLSVVVEEVCDEVGVSFECFCLIVGLVSLMQMLEEDVVVLVGVLYVCVVDKLGYCWGCIRGFVGFYGGKVEVECLWVCLKIIGKELLLFSWKEVVEVGWLE